MMTRIGAMVRKGWSGFLGAGEVAPHGCQERSGTFRTEKRLASKEAAQPVSWVRTRADCLAAEPVDVWPAEACRMVRVLKIQLEELEEANHRLRHELEVERRSRHVVRMDALLENVRACYADACHAKGVTLTTGIAQSVPERLAGDPERLGQLLAQLLENALRRTSQGQIRVAIDTLPHLDQRTVRLCLTVFDTGPCMDKVNAEHHAGIAPGASEGAALDHDLESSLAGIRKLAEEMGGQLRLQGLEGVYTTISCALNLMRFSKRNKKLPVEE